MDDGVDIVCGASLRVTTRASGRDVAISHEGLKSYNWVEIASSSRWEDLPTAGRLAMRVLRKTLPLFPYHFINLSLYNFITLSLPQSPNPTLVSAKKNAFPVFPTIAGMVGVFTDLFPGFTSIRGDVYTC